MAKITRKVIEKAEAEEEETAAVRAVTDVDVLPGETIDQWAERKNREEGIGPDGRYTYVPGHTPKVSDDYDPNMGSL